MSQYHIQNPGERGLLELAAAELVRNPRASTAAIARACGIGRATLNRKFTSRRALLEAIALDALGQVDEIAAAHANATTASEYLAAMLEPLVLLGDRFRVLDQDPDLNALPEIRERLEEHRRFTIDLARRLKAVNTIVTTPAGLAVPDAFFAAALDGLLFSAWVGIADGHIAVRDAPGLIHRVLFQGLQSPRPS